jgi:hypothetical protein
MLYFASFVLNHFSKEAQKINLFFALFFAFGLSREFEASRIYQNSNSIRPLLRAISGVLQVLIPCLALKRVESDPSKECLKVLISIFELKVLSEAQLEVICEGEIER